MRENVKKALLILCILLLIAAVFVGCNKSDGDVTYTVTIKGDGGAPVANASVYVLKDGETFMAGKTGTDGVYVFKAAKYNYGITLAGLPSGYMYSGDAYYFEDGKNTLEISLMSATSSVTLLDGEFGIIVANAGGLRLQGVSVEVSLAGGEVANGVTGQNVSGIQGGSSPYGAFIFKGDAARYNIKLTNLPAGYEESEGRVFTADGESNPYTVEVQSKLLSAPEEGKRYAPGDVFFDFEIKDVISGRQYKLSNLLESKKMVLLNFWNTACAPCMSEMPSLAISYENHKNDVEVLAISVILSYWNTETEIINTYNSLNPKPTFPMFADGPTPATGIVAFTRYLDLGSIPKSLVIDRYGVVALLHTGSMGTAEFDEIFEEYSADDYRQSPIPGASGGEEEQPQVERVEPSVTQASSDSIKAKINGSGFDGEWYPESESADAKYSWPWQVGSITDAGRQVDVLTPANHAVPYSFATIKTKVTVSQSDIDNGGNVALVFDLKYQTEDYGDYFYVIVNNDLVYEFTGTEHFANWQSCYAFVADEPGEYEMTLLYDKDQQVDGGADVVYVKDVRLVPESYIDANERTLDMPRDAAKRYDPSTKTFGYYADAELAPDGYYHYGDASGPYLLANLYKIMAFNARGFDSNVSEATVAGFFNYNTVPAEDPSYDPSLDKSDDITPYLMAANNSELPGLTVVTKELADLLDEFAKSRFAECVSGSWKEFCIWFEHYGNDPSDIGICEESKNPVRGLMKQSAIPMVEVHVGEFENLGNIDSRYKNQVDVNRIIVPRGIMYKIVPDVSGAYRFRSQSSAGSDTTAWLRDEACSMEQCLVEYGSEREWGDAEYNFVLTWYLEEGKTYYLSVSTADVGGTAKFTFTTEYLGEEFYSWQNVSTNAVTFTDTGSDTDIGELRNVLNAYPVLAPDGYYYDAVRDEDGAPIAGRGGAYTPDMSDPIYVDFFTMTSFMPETLSDIIDMGETNAVLSRLWTAVFPRVFGDSVNGLPQSRFTELVDLNDGEPLSDQDWIDIAAALTATYGDTVYFDTESDVFTALMECNTVSDIINALKRFFLSAFDFSAWTDIFAQLGYTNVGNFSNLAKEYREKARATLEAPEFSDAQHDGYVRGGVRYGMDAGAVRLDSIIQPVLELFARRYGWLELGTDWVRLCKHYERIGAYQG